MIAHDDLSPDQRAAYDAILAWALEGRPAPGQTDPRLLTLGGFAGCGDAAPLADSDGVVLIFPVLVLVCDACARAEYFSWALIEAALDSEVPR